MWKRLIIWLQPRYIPISAWAKRTAEYAQQVSINWNHPETLKIKFLLRCTILSNHQGDQSVRRTFTRVERLTGIKLLELNWRTKAFLQLYIAAKALRIKPAEILSMLPRSIKFPFCMIFTQNFSEIDQNAWNWAVPRIPNYTKNIGMQKPTTPTIDNQWDKRNSPE